MTTLNTFRPCGFQSGVRRHASGSIDVDFYRDHATAMRGQMCREDRLIRRGALGLLALAAIFVAALVVAAAQTYAPAGERFAIQAAASPPAR